MCRQVEENRLHVRFSFSALARYTVLGEIFHPPREAPAEAEIIDLSDYGVRICLRGSTVKVGFLVVLRIPVSETRTTVPTLV